MQALHRSRGQVYDQGRIGDHNWEIGALKFEHKKTEASLQGDINWLQSANELVHQKKDSLQEEVHTLRQEMESQKKLSIDKGNTSSIDTISSSSTTYTQQ